MKKKHYFVYTCIYMFVYAMLFVLLFVCVCSVLSEIVLEGSERSDAYSGLLNVIQVQPSLVTPELSPPIGALPDTAIGALLFLKSLIPSWRDLAFDESTTEGADSFLRARQAIISLRGYYQGISATDKKAAILIALFHKLEEIFPV